MSKEKTIELKPIEVKRAVVTIEGDGDLVLNKMNARTTRELMDERRGKKTISQVPNVWEDIITAVRWRDPIPAKDTYAECDEEMYYKMLRENKPCISAFGLKKSFGEAVVRNNIDAHSTKFHNAVNVVAKNGLVPVDVTAATVDERLMKPRGSGPVLARFNHFSGWRAQIEIAYTENIYSLEQIVNIINLAGFGLGIGSGRSSGYGRYHVTGVAAA